MIQKFVAPRMGEGVTQVNVIRWIKQPGDLVREYEALVEVETDKVATEIPSPVNGKIAQILIPAGQVAQVGDILAEIEFEGESTPHKSVAGDESTIVTEVTSILAPDQPEQKSTERHWISPVVAKIAKENQIDLSQVKGTGFDGRITKQDVLLFVNSRPSYKSVMPAEISGDLLPLTTIRRQIAQHMLDSVHTAAHVLSVMEADMSAVIADQERRQADFAARGVRLTYTAYFIRALAKALRSVPLVNSSWQESGIRLHSEIHIGMAVSLGGDGLIVPVIRAVDTLNLFGIAKTIQDLAARARSKRLMPDDVKGATFTLTNHGIGGSLFATPIINQPQTGILGTGIIQKRVVVLTDPNGRDSIAIRPMMYLSFVFDHRILDGSTADQFLVKVKQTLEQDLEE